MKLYQLAHAELDKDILEALQSNPSPDAFKVAVNVQILRSLGQISGRPKVENKEINTKKKH